MRNAWVFLGVMALTAALSASLTACSSSSSAAAPHPAAVQDDADGGDPNADAAPPRSPACATMDAKIQATLDGRTKVSPNAIFALKNEACGASSYVTGPTASATATSLFRIASITKTFTSTVIVSLAKDGALSLEDPIDKWVPKPGFPGVTLRMLLNHTSGIADYTADRGLVAASTTPHTPPELVAIAAKHAPTGMPGASWNYSNTNYILLGMVAEAAGKDKLGALAHKRGIDRLKLKSTFFDGEERLVGTLVKGFDTSNVDATYAWDPSNSWAAGGMVATATDLAEWVYGLYGSDAVLDADTVAKLTAPPLFTMSDGQSKYGVGVMVLPAAAMKGGGLAIGHAGDIDGYHSMAFYLPTKKVSVVAFVNSDADDPFPLLQALLPVVFASMK